MSSFLKYAVLWFSIVTEENYETFSWFRNLIKTRDAIKSPEIYEFPVRLSSSLFSKKFLMYFRRWTCLIITPTIRNCTKIKRFWLTYFQGGNLVSSISTLKKDIQTSLQKQTKNIEKNVQDVINKQLRKQHQQLTELHTSLITEVRLLLIYLFASFWSHIYLKRLCHFSSNINHHLITVHCSAFV